MAIIFLFDEDNGYFKSTAKGSYTTFTYTKCQSEAYKFSSEKEAKEKIEEWRTYIFSAWRAFNHESKFIPIPD